MFFQATFYTFAFTKTRKQGRAHEWERTILVQIADNII